MTAPKLDPVFSVGFITRLLSRLPLRVTNRVEEFTRERGFSSLLCAFLASPRAQERLSQALLEALDLAKKNPELLETERAGVYSSATLGNLRNQ